LRRDVFPAPPAPMSMTAVGCVYLSLDTGVWADSSCMSLLARSSSRGRRPRSRSSLSSLGSGIQFRTLLFVFVCDVDNFFIEASSDTKRGVDAAAAGEYKLVRLILDEAL